MNMSIEFASLGNDPKLMAAFACLLAENSPPADKQKAAYWNDCLSLLLDAVDRDELRRQQQFVRL